METTTLKTAPFDVERIRADFPILQETVNGHPLVYFDNGATAQKPQAVLDVLDAYYRNLNSNVHRGVHTLSQTATDHYEDARRTVQRFINAAEEHEIIFTKGTTDAINLVAGSFSRGVLKTGDEVLITGMEHHSNIVPWQLACETTGATLRVIPVDETGELILDDLDTLLNDRTRIVAVVHVSNTLGTVNPIERLIEAAHARAVPVLVDGAQAIPHQTVDVQALDADFYCFSGHKVFGPTGIGILYGKEAWLDRLPPYQGGGSMIRTVSFEKTTYAELPHKFEAGTPHIAGGLGLAAALRYVSNIGLDVIAAYEADLLGYATEALEALGSIRIVGTAPHKAAVLSFLVDGMHPYDTGTLLDQMGIAARTGHHCTMPLMEQYGIPGTVRASLAFYNTKGEIDRLVDGLKKVMTLFA